MGLLDLLFPRRCVSCGKFGNYFCRRCTSKIEFIRQPVCPVCTKPAIDGVTHPRCRTRYTLDGLTSIFRYNGIIRQAVKLLKYRLVTDLAKEFIDLIPFSFFQATLNNQQLPILVPIPLHPSRLRARGFNQVEVLGKILSRRLNIPMRTNILVRIKKTIPQVEMQDRKKRLENMEGVFSVQNLAVKELSNMTTLLFDDVFTTGATLRSAANILKRSGVKKVWSITLAHG